MRADLDLLCISVYCTADDLLPERRRNARRKLSDAEIVTLCVAQVLMGIPSDRRFLRAGSSPARALVSVSAQPGCAAQAARAVGGDDRVAYRHVRRGEPSGSDELLLLDSTPIECGRSLETVRRSQLADICGYGYSKAIPAGFGGCGCNLACAPDGARGRAHYAAASARRRRPSR
jgi:hypothetical protein